MRYHLKLGLITLLVSLLMNGLAQAEGEKSAPTIHIEDRTFDFGEVPRGQLIKHIFTVTNKGTAPLEIKKIQPD